MEIFRKLEKDAADFEQKRRESRRETPARSRIRPGDRGRAEGCSTHLLDRLLHDENPVGFDARKSLDSPAGPSNLNLRYYRFRT